MPTKLAFLIVLVGLSGSFSLEGVHAQPPFAGPVDKVPAWEPAVHNLFSPYFSVLGMQFDPEEKTFSWTLRTLKPFPGPLGLAERDLEKDLAKIFAKGYPTAYYYDEKHRKLGENLLNLTIGERAHDDHFLCFVDLPASPLFHLACRIVVTVKPIDEGLDKSLPRNGKNNLEEKK